MVSSRNFGKIYCTKIVHFLFVYKKGFNWSIFNRNEKIEAKIGENNWFSTYFSKKILDMGLKYAILVIKEKIGITYYYQGDTGNCTYFPYIYF